MKTVISFCFLGAVLTSVSSAHAYQLTVSTVGPGRVDPNAGTYSDGTVVTIQTWPADGYWVTSWYGTDNDWSIDLSNTVTMDANKIVTVEFGPAIVVERPAGGDTWTSASTHLVRWSSYGAGNVDIYFSKNGGMSWQALEAGVADTGSYTWHVPANVNSSQCVILVVPAVFDPNVISIQSEMFRIHPDSPGPLVQSKWKTLGGDFDRKGLSEDKGPELGCIKWEFEVDGAISASVTAGPNETVYVPCEDGKLYKLDANGALLWSYDANTPLISAATLGPDGTAYVGGKNGRLYAIALDGHLRWTHITDGSIYSSPALSPDGNSIYVGSQDGKLYALGRDGSERWAFETKGFGVLDGSILASAAVGPDGTVYVAGLYDPNLYALDANNGGVKWACHFDSNGWPFASPVIGPDGTIYQTLLYDANLYAIDPNNGNIIWTTHLSPIWTYGYDSYSQWFEPYYYEHMSFEPELCDNLYWNAKYDVSDSGWSEPVVGPDGTIYVSFDDPWLRAVDPSGSIKWIRKVGSTMGFNLTLGSDGLIYAASNDSNLYVLDNKGFDVGRFDSNNAWLDFPVISADNKVVVSDSRDNSWLINYENNKVWAIGSEGCGGKEPVLYWQGGPQDLDGNGVVDYIDLRMLAADWLKCTDCWNELQCGWVRQKFFAGDINRDRYVDLWDFAVLADRWLGGY